MPRTSTPCPPTLSDPLCLWVSQSSSASLHHWKAVRNLWVTSKNATPRHEPLRSALPVRSFTNTSTLPCAQSVVLHKLSCTHVKSSFPLSLGTRHTTSDLRPPILLSHLTVQPLHLQFSSSSSSSLCWCAPAYFLPHSTAHWPTARLCVFHNVPSDRRSHLVGRRLHFCIHGRGLLADHPPEL